MFTLTKNTTYDMCHYTKQHKLPSTQSYAHSLNILESIHVDIL